MLYIVATPIGNLDDITLRALDILKKADIIACEDTRHTKLLLDRHNIKANTISFHQHSGGAKLDKIIEYLEEGKDVALVTDAGTPGISDPGSKLVERAIEANIDLTSVPGATAFVTALSMSGFDIHEFIFVGFLPHKKGRQTKLKEIASEKRTVALYESVHRIKKLLKELTEFIPEREICVTRELTKKFEDIYRGKPSEIIEKVKEKGEFVVIIEGKR
jgi:16S rRNA (cytidine1402-2'-O)-methyltransferase